MKFLVKSVCKICGRSFDNSKRYNPFLDEWELDADTCEKCKQKMMIEDYANSIPESFVHL